MVLTNASFGIGGGIQTQDSSFVQSAKGMHILYFTHLTTEG
jgi:hypothetical protein